MKENVIEIQEEVRINQGNQEVILEKGDKIKVLKEAKYPKYSDKIASAADEVISDLIKIIDNLNITLNDVQYRLGMLGIDIQNRPAESVIADIKEIIKTISVSKVKNKY